MCVCVCCGEYALQNVVAREAVVHVSEVCCCREVCSACVYVCVVASMPCKML